MMMATTTMTSPPAEGPNLTDLSLLDFVYCLLLGLVKLHADMAQFLVNVLQPTLSWSASGMYPHKLLQVQIKDAFCWITKFLYY